MTYTEAVKAALNGEESGHTFLFEETYKSKLYLAIQYMKNEEAAEDVLQDAYIKAFNRLDSLKDPEHFSAWFGQIVANTAKDALEKKNPVLFTDIASDTEEDTSDYDVADEDISHQPELSYTREETRQIVQELMDSLSPEQRICVLMRYIDGESIKEIAEALDCSENTVKSRLNYGKKNLKTKVEELEKKGYKILGIAPIAFFIMLFHNDAYAMSLDPEFIDAVKEVGKDVFRHLPDETKGPGGPGGPEKSEGSEGLERSENSGKPENIERPENPERPEGENQHKGPSFPDGREETDVPEGHEHGPKSEEHGKPGEPHEHGDRPHSDFDTGEKAGKVFETGEETSAEMEVGAESAVEAGEAPEIVPPTEAGTGEKITEGAKETVKEGAEPAAEKGAKAAAGEAVKEAGAEGIKTAAKEGTKAAVKAGFIHTALGKAVIAVVGVIIVGGSVAGVTQVQKQHEQERLENTIESVMAERDATENGEGVASSNPGTGNDSEFVGAVVEVTETEPETEAKVEEESPVVRTVADNEYPELLEGDLTKDQFEVVLSYAPSAMSSGEMTAEDLVALLDNLAMDAMFDVRYSGDFNSFIGVDGWRWEGEDVDDIYYSFNLSQLDRFISVLTDPLTQEMLNRGTRWDPTISQDTLSVYIGPGDGGYHNTATIIDSILIENYEIAVTYEVISKAATVNTIAYDEVRTAVLKQTSDGRYKVDSISKGWVESVVVDDWEINLNMVRQGNTQNTPISSEDAEAIRTLYERVLKDVQDGKYEFTMLENIFEGYGYFLLDMNGDGIKELVVSAKSTPGTGVGSGVFIFDDCRVFTAGSRDGAWVLQPIGGEVEPIEEYAPADGNGFYGLEYFGRASGDAGIYRITIQNGELMKGANEYYSAADGTLQHFENINPVIDCFDITDLSGLDEVVVSYVKKASEAGSDAASGDGSIFPDSSTRVLTSSEIAALSDADLRVAINEIYARHGYIFESQDLLDHFRQFDWYHETVPKTSWNDSMFNSVEKQNVNLLSAERSRR